MKKFLVWVGCCLALMGAWKLVMPEALGQVVPAGTGGGSGGSGGSFTFDGGSFTCTNGPVQLFVDCIAGNDNNSCLTAGSACKTPIGADKKLPADICHPVVINVADGGCDGLALYGHNFLMSDAGVVGTINWVGSVSAATLDGGTATGTATGGSSTTLQDTAQIWTVNDVRMKGRLLRILSGTGVGAYLPIVSNTADTITVAGAFSATPTGTSVYEISDWNSVFQNTINSPAIPGTAAGTPLALRMEGNNSMRMGATPSVTLTSGASITFTNIAFAPVTAAQGAVRINGPNQVAFTGVKIAGSTSGAGLSVLYGSAVSIDRSWISSGTGVAFSNNFGNTTASYVQAYGNLIESSVTTAGLGVLSLPTSGTFSTNRINALVSGTYGAIVSSTIPNGNVNLSGNLITCTSGGSTFGLSLFGQGMNVNFNTSGTVITSCDTAIDVQFNNSVVLTLASTITGSGAQTTALRARKGGKILITTAPTVSGYTNEVTVDDVTSTVAAITGASPPVLSTSYTSLVGQ